MVSVRYILTHPNHFKGHQMKKHRANPETYAVKHLLEDAYALAGLIDEASLMAEEEIEAAPADHTNVSKFMRLTEFEDASKLAWGLIETLTRLE